MNTNTENLIIDSLNKKSKHTLNRFECSECGQMYIYIIAQDVKTIKCPVCDINMFAEGEI